jgi:hypothetical protein
LRSIIPLIFTIIGAGKECGETIHERGQGLLEFAIRKVCRVDKCRSPSRKFLGASKAGLQLKISDEMGEK